MQYRHIVVAPADWADAECVPPHDLSDKPAVWPTGPAAPKLQAVMDARRAIVVARSAWRANQVWLWGQGSQPQMPSFRDAHGVSTAALVTAVDLVRGLGVLTDMDVVEVAGATGWFDTDYEGKRDAALRTPRRRRRPVRHPRRGHRRGRPRRQRRREGQGARELGPAASSPAWSRASTPSARGGCCCCPTTPRPLHSKTHTSDPVPYLLVDDGIDGSAGGTYTEAGVADRPSVPGHELMGRLVANRG